MALTRSKELLTKLNERLADLRQGPLPPLGVQQAWLNGLSECLEGVYLILSELLQGVFGVDPDEVPETKEPSGVDGAPGGDPPGAEGGGGLGGKTPVP